MTEAICAWCGEEFLAPEDVFDDQVACSSECDLMLINRDFDPPTDED